MPPRTWDPGNTGSQSILRTSHPGCHSIKPVNCTAILAVTQSNQSTGQPFWQPLNQTSQLDSHSGSHSIKPVSESWRSVGRLEGGGLGGLRPPHEGPDDGGGFPTALDIWRSPGPTCPGTTYPVQGIPHFDMSTASWE